VSTSATPTNPAIVPTSGFRIGQRLGDGGGADRRGGGAGVDQSKWLDAAYASSP
jgi:hypothetical protein